MSDSPEQTVPEKMATVTVPVHILQAAINAVLTKKRHYEEYLSSPSGGRPSERAMTMVEVKYLGEFVDKAREAKNKTLEPVITESRPQTTVTGGSLPSEPQTHDYIPDDNMPGYLGCRKCGFSKANRIHG